MQHHSLKQARGFSLIELMMTLAILAIACVFAAPSFAALAKKSQMESARDQVLTLMHLARTSAIAQRQEVIVCGGNGHACTANWRDGAMVFIDRNRNRQLDGNESVSAHLAATDLSTTHLLGNRAYTRFNAQGRASGTNQTIRICLDNNPEAMTVVVANSGRVRSGKGRCS